LESTLYETKETPKAIFLIQEGFDLLKIRYELKNNGKKRGIFVFNHHPNEVKQSEMIYERGDANINLLRYEHIRESILDRLKKELP
jgi:hypothetical protein